MYLLWEYDMVTGRHMYFDLDSGRFIVHKKKVFSIGDANAYWTEFSKVVDGTYIIKDFYFLVVRMISISFSLYAQKMMMVIVIWNIYILLRFII